MQRHKTFAGAGTALALLIALPPSVFAQTYSSPVRITNSPAQFVPTRDTDHPARSPFRKNFQITIQGNDRGGDILNVPQGFRLVIETFSASVDVPIGEKVKLSFTSTVTSNGSPVTSTTYVPAFLQGTFAGSDTFFADQPMRVYVDPTGFTLSVSVFKTTSNGSAFADITISGYLVPLS
jgi:hypothetical protein